MEKELKIPNIEEIINLDDFINKETFKVIQNNNNLKDVELINMKSLSIMRYAQAVYENKPRNTKKYEKFVSELTIECVSSFLGFSNKLFELNVKREVIEKAKLGGDFIVNTIKPFQINNFKNNGKVIVKKNGNSINTVEKTYINKDIITLQKYQNLLNFL